MRLFRPSPDWMAEHLGRLFAAEERACSMRARGDWAYEDGRERACTEYHEIARQAEQSAAQTRALLQSRLGPDRDGEAPETVDPDTHAAARKASAPPADPWGTPDADFASACFFARHPRWCSGVPRFENAYQAWRHDPRFRAQAPGFRPVNPGWRD